MSYTSGDWTARQRYLLSSSLCFPTEDPNALLEFSSGLLSHASGDASGDASGGSSGSSGSSGVPPPFFPVYNGAPASMQFSTVSYLDLSGSSADLCSVTLTDASGKLGIWGSIDATGAPFTIELVLNGSVVAQSSTSPYIFFGTAAAMPLASYTATLQCSTSGFLEITAASIMMVGSLT